MSLRSRVSRWALPAAALVVLSVVHPPVAAAAVPAPAEPVPVRIIAVNDLHGALEPPAGSSGQVTDAGVAVPAGGAAFLAAHVDRLRAGAPNSVVLSSGDNVGASPVASALFHDEPTIELLNLLGVEASAVGNHEFDEGYDELRRLQGGGCHPVDGCVFRPDFRGANFPFLGANVTTTDGEPALPVGVVVETGGVRVGVIGAVLEDVPTVVSAEGIAGLAFGPEIAGIDAASAELSALGVEAQVVLLHQGDEGAGGGPNECAVEPGGPGSAIAAGVTPAVDAVFSAHSHQQYACSVIDPAGAPRPFVQGLSAGRLLSVVDIAVDPATGDVVRELSSVRNEVVTRDIAPDPEAQALVDQAVAAAAPIAAQPVGTIAADLLRAQNPAGESPLGDVIADAHLAATADAGAQVALTNPGGIRADLPAGAGGVVTYGDVFTVQPFGNILQVVTLTGAQLDAVLEQQWADPADPAVLQVSSTLRYTWSASAPAGEKVSGITVDGAPVDPAAPYRVAVNNFLQAGGDGFTVFTEGTDLVGGPVDLEAFLAYLEANPGLAVPVSDRITVTP